MGKSPARHEGPNGGLLFFFSLASICFVAVFNALALPDLIPPASGERWRIFLGAACLGVIGAWVVIRNHLSVALHEFKHALVSNLVGNRAKVFFVDKESGHFEYEFTKHTAHHNATIALAPYWFPLGLLLCMAVGMLFLRDTPLALIALAGFGWGLDGLTNLRDISPVQTDLTTIRGGFGVGMLYVVALNLAISSLLIIAVTAGSDGLLALIRLYLEFALRLGIG